MVLQVVGNADKAEAAILEACKGDATARMLYSLGIQLGISSWQEQWQQICARSVPLNTGPAQPSGYIEDNHAGILPADHADGPQICEQPAATSDELERFLQPEGSLLGTLLPGAEFANATQGDVAASCDAPDVCNEQPAGASEESRDGQAIIECIRQDEYGVGVEQQVSAAKLIHRLNKRTGRALHRLSQDLYSKHIHFVLELIQNADDNNYEAHVPAMEFILQDTGITIVNNEVSFNESRIAVQDKGTCIGCSLCWYAEVACHIFTCQTWNTILTSHVPC